MRKQHGKILSLFLALALLAGLCVPPALAAESRYNDTKGHWAEAAIERWSGYGVVQGYGGGFAPDGSLTRAQMAVIIAKALGLTETKGNPFSDVPGDTWYTQAVLQCYAAGIMVGSNGRANPGSPISRQEAIAMLGRALAITPEENPDLSGFTDGESVASWAAPMVAAMTKAGIISGVGNHRFAPGLKMTRASVMTVLDRAVVQYINAPGSYELTDKAGIVLVAAGGVTLTGSSRANILVTPAADGKEVTFSKAAVTGTVTVQADNAKVINKNSSSLPNVVLAGQGSKVEESRPASSGGGSSSGGGGSTPSYSNLVVAESKTVSETATYQDVTVTDAVGDGTVTLANLTIRGNLYINGGGSGTINLQNCVIMGKIIMAKASGQTPRLHLTNTPVAAVEANKPAIIEAADATSAVASIQAKANVEIRGASTTVTAVSVPAGVETAVNVTVTAGTVAKVEARSVASVTGAANTVKEVVAEASVTVASGAVKKVEVPATAADVTVNVQGSSAIEVQADSASTKIAADNAENVTVSGTAKDDVTPHTHSWNAGEVTKQPTCAEEGVKTYTCTAENCPVQTKTEAIAKTAHTPVTDAAVAADCLGPGKTEGQHCSVCNTVLKAQEVIPPLGHSFAEEYQSDADGHWHKCTRCDKTDEKAAHAYPAGASCDSAATCTVCGYAKAAGEHSWDEGKVTTAPTCTGKGVKTFTCTVCKQTKTEEVTALDHDWDEWTKADATNHKRTCKRDATHTETEAHTWDAGVITTEPTETTEGVKTYTCSVCKGTKTESVPMVSTECTLGTPELKTDGSRVWVEATVENLPADAKVGIWISSSSTSPRVTLGKESKYFVLDGNNLKCYLDQTISTQFSGGTLALSIIDTDIKTAYTTKTLTAATPTNSQEILVAAKADDNTSITISKQDGSKFEDKGVYGCTLTVPNITYTCSVYFDSFTADGAIKFNDYNNYVPTATEATVWQAVPTADENGVIVSYIQYPAITLTTP